MPRHASLLPAVAAVLLAAAAPVHATSRPGTEKRAAEAPPTADKPGCAHCAEEKAAGAAPAKTSLADARVAVVDRTLRDQEGRRVRFAREVLGDDVVVMDFVFTHCGTVCPVLSAKMARLQQLLGGRLGKGVRLVTLSLDPVRDTPERLKAWGARFKAGPHWQLVTGPQEDQEAVLKGLGAYVADVSQHPPMILVGDARSGRWVRMNGFPDPHKVVSLVEEMLASRATTAAHAGGR